MKAKGLGTIVLALSLIGFGCGRWGMAYRPATNSMAPTLDIDDACSVNPLEYVNHPIERFDIVVFQSPAEIKERHGTSGDVLYIKRVAGLPGEKIEVRNNVLFVDDRRIDEPFQTIKNDGDLRKNFGPVTVPEGEYFLLGDNRPNSEDSRYYQHPTIRKADIYSKVTKIHTGYYSQR